MSSSIGTGTKTGTALFLGFLWSLSLPVFDVAAQALPDTSALIAKGSLSTLVQGIGDAENAVMTSDGRLFVTGGENAYEITEGAEGYTARPLYPQKIGCNGIVERNGYLYTVCAEGTDLNNVKSHVLAAKLSEQVTLQSIYDFKNMWVPNGAAFDAQGRLFVTDFAPLAGKIVTLTFAPSDPLRIVKEETWHDMGHPLANGLKIFKNNVYLTDLTDVKVIPILPNGRAGKAKVIAMRLSVFDDLYVSDAGIIVGDFYGGQLVYYSLTGKMLKQTPAQFRSPSSITPGRPPLAPEGSLIVTEKGALGELTSTDGNRVSVFVPQP